MPRRTLARLLSAAVAGLTAGALGACSDQSPVATGPAPGAGAAQVSLLSQLADGRGDLSFVTGSFGEVTLVAQVTDADGNLAQGGEVTFQFCAQKGDVDFGIPSGPLPSSECDAGGSGRWVRAARVPVVDGTASFSFCCVSPNTILGFRFVYTGQGSGIGNFTTLGKDYSTFA